jgi:hypothetical protein
VEAVSSVDPQNSDMYVLYKYLLHHHGYNVVSHDKAGNMLGHGVTTCFICIRNGARVVAVENHMVLHAWEHT